VLEDVGVDEDMLDVILVEGALYELSIKVFKR
jgi:hypothetical protein